jgi:thermostable 8-oxoguanine DNA glycosylase
VGYLPYGASQEEYVSLAALSVASESTAELWWAPVWARHAHRYQGTLPARRAGETALRKELIFCLLGGHGVTYELALSAMEAVSALEPFDERWTPGRLRRALHRELTKPQFGPRRPDGSMRRYRFPTRKARLITDAVFWVRSQGGIRAGLATCETEAHRRSWLCGCPGVGMKTSSWILRNCGWARRLAIIDVHLLRALDEAQLVYDPRLPRDYELVEQVYLDWADRLGACPAALDLFLWEVQRSR